jgi:hypothetical protein
VAPTLRGQNTSHTEVSKLMGVFTSIRSAPVRGYAFCNQAMRLTMPAWGTATPLGRPVDPEVYSTYDQAVGSTSTGAPGSSPSRTAATDATSSRTVVGEASSIM